MDGSAPSPRRRPGPTPIHASLMLAPTCDRGAGGTHTHTHARTHALHEPPLHDLWTDGTVREGVGVRNVECPVVLVVLSLRPLSSAKHLISATFSARIGLCLLLVMLLQSGSQRCARPPDARLQVRRDLIQARAE